MWNILWNGLTDGDSSGRLDKKLLQAADRAAVKTKQSRSAWVREALREYLQRLEVRSMEERDRQGYAKLAADDAVWETGAVSPAE